MKKLTAAILFLTILFSVATAELYPLAGKIIDLDFDEDTVTFIDGAGNFWSFSGIEDWWYGDVVACIMDDSGTSSIEDNVVMVVRYAGLF